MIEAIKAFLKILIPVKFRAKLRAAQERASYFGLRYKCPICKARLKTFFPFGFDFPVIKDKKIVGGGCRQNAVCPICGSYDRERLLYLYLLHKTDIFQKPKKLLHIAPEEAVEKILRAKVNIDYLTADVAAKNVMVAMDITDIRFPDNSFDAIICNHVLEHVIDDGKAMSELYRILNPGGCAILQVPISLTLKNTYEDFSITTITGREQAFGQDDHVRIYAEDYQARLAQAGFKVNVFKWVNETKKFGGRRNVFGLIEKEDVYSVTNHR